MKKSFFHYFCWTVLCLLFAFVSCGCALLVRLSFGPVSLGTCLPFMHRVAHTYDASLRCGSLSLAWKKQCLILHVRNLQGKNYQLEKADLSFPLLHLALLHVMPQRIAIDGLALTIVPSASLCTPQESFIQILPKVLSFTEIEAQQVTLSFQIADQRWTYPNLFILAKHNNNSGLCTVLEKPVPHTSPQVDLEVSYKLFGTTCIFDSTIRRFLFPMPCLMPQWQMATPLMLTGKVQGKASVLRPEWSVSCNVHQNATTASILDGKRALPVKNLVLKGTMQPGFTHIDMCSVTLDTSDIVLKGYSKLVEKCIWKGAIDVHLTKNPLSIGWLPILWPKDAGVNARDWIIPHFKKGYISLMQGRIEYTLDPELTIDVLYGKLGIRDVTLAFYDKLPPIEKLNATSDFNLKGFDIKVQSGVFMGQKLMSGSIQITPLAGLPWMYLNVSLDGPLRPLLQGVRNTTLSYAKAVPIVIPSVSGHNTLALRMKFPLLAALETKHIDFSFRSVIKQGAFRLESEAIPLAVKEGDITLQGTHNDLKIDAKSKVNDIAMQWRWDHVFDKEKEANLYLKGAPVVGQLEKIVSRKLSPYMQGAVSIEAHYYPFQNTVKGKATLHNTTVVLPWIGWKKNPGTALTAQIDVVLHKKMASQMRLSIAGALQASLTCTTSPAGSISYLSGTLQTPSTYRVLYRHSAQGTQLSLHGAFLDLRDLLDKPSNTSLNKSSAFWTHWAEQNEWSCKKSLLKQVVPTGPQENLALDIHCQHLVLKKGIAFSDISGHLCGYTINPKRSWLDFSNIRWTKGSLTAHLLTPRVLFSRKKKKRHKKNLITLSIVPWENNMTRLTLCMQNIGAVLRAFDVTERVSKGTLKIDALQDCAGLYRGSMYVHTVRTDAPVLGKLLAMASPAIFLEFLSPQLMFSEVKCFFRYRDGQLLIENAVGQGINLGISARGKLDFDKNYLDMQGVIVPIYWLNTFFSYVPLLGWIFGGDNGVLSAEFSLYGSLENPDIRVHPLSIFKLGFMKSLFEDNTDFSIEKRQGTPHSIEVPISEDIEGAGEEEEDEEEEEDNV